MSSPTTTILALIEDNWQTGNTPMANSPEFHTGTYSDSSRKPAVTLYGRTENPTRGGSTGYAYMNGETGNGVQLLKGKVTIDCVAGTRDDCEGIGTSGENLNPKAVRDQLYDEVARIIGAHQLDPNFRALSCGSSKEREDKIGSDDPVTVFVTETRAAYLRLR